MFSSKTAISSLSRPLQAPDGMRPSAVVKDEEVCVKSSWSWSKEVVGNEQGLQVWVWQ